MICEIIAVGTEILMGNIVNTNAQELSQALSSLGINVYWQTVVGDNPERLRSVLETARARADLIGTRIALVVSFNEWVLGEQISLENSKDIEPSKTYGTLYLDIMKEQIKKFKGDTAEYLTR